MTKPALPKWRHRLNVERSHVSQFEALSERELASLAQQNDPLSSNHDTVLSIDWPHYCSFATEACGGPRGWCYTFSGFHVTPAQARKVALNDVLARRLPKEFAMRVTQCVRKHVERGRLPYENLRFSGAGEISISHVPALESIQSLGVRSWGFTKNPHVAEQLAGLGIAVIFSADHSTDPCHLGLAQELGVPIAYSSRSISDSPPKGVLVTFPVHISGRVSEVIDHPTVCPKVVEEFIHGIRTPAWCQNRCQKCHLNTVDGVLDKNIQRGDA